MVAVESVANRRNKNPYQPLAPPELPTFGTVPIIPHNLIVIFRLARPRTWAFPVLSFILGYTISGGGPLYPVLLGLGVASLVTASTNLVNAYADRREDAVNQPSRVFLVDRIGARGALAASLLFYGIAGALSIYLGPLFILVLAIGIFNSLFYSLPPLRFKAKPLASLVSFSGAVGLAFLSGYSINGSINLFNPVFLLATYFMLTYGTVKNLPDYSGDKRAGTRTSATIFADVRKAVLFTGVLLFTPYILLITLVETGLLSTIYLLDLGLALILALIVNGMWKAKTPEGLEKAHTFGFFYAISFLAFTLVLSSPTLQSLTAVTGAFVWTLLVSQVKVDSRIEKRDWEKRRSKS
jgi:4-hydroxybenzoate polyprenyltransferase